MVYIRKAFYFANPIAVLKVILQICANIFYDLVKSDYVSLSPADGNVETPHTFIRQKSRVTAGETSVN